MGGRSLNRIGGFSGPTIPRRPDYVEMRLEDVERAREREYVRKDIDEAKGKFDKFARKEFREHQGETVLGILNSEKRFVIVSAPTGSGKTLIGMTAGATFGDVSYMVHSKILQNQITDDFPEAMSLFGRANYTCVKSVEDGFVEDALTCDDCLHTPDHQCSYKRNRGCLYEDAKKDTRRHPYRILNYDYFLSEANYVGNFSGNGMCVVDEADNLENALIGFVSLELSNYVIGRLNLHGPARRTAKGAKGIESWFQFIRYLKKVCREELRRTVGLLKDVRDYRESGYALQLVRWKKSLEGLLTKSEQFERFVDDTWIFDDRFEGKYIFRPLWMNEKVAEHFIWKHSNRWVLMSATFPPRHVVCKILGIPEDEAEFIEVPSTFNPERRKVVVKPVANITSKTVDEEVPKLVKGIRSILRRHPKEKGLIHCVSYDMAERLETKLRHNRIITHHNTKDRAKILDKFRDSDKPLVLMSPSMERGVSLPDELCRFIVVVKAPFLNLGDKIVSKRTFSGVFGRLWYQTMMLMTVVQMTGRGMRHEDDYVKSYILDEQFSRVMTERPSIVPMWWRDALEWENGDSVGSDDGDEVIEDALSSSPDTN